MSKKAFAAAAAAVALTFVGATAASAAFAAEQYPVVQAECTAAPSTIRVGESSTITCVWDDESLDGTVVTFSTDGPGITSDSLSSLVLASNTGVASVERTIVADTASVVFTGPAARVYPITISWGETAQASAQVEIPITVVDESGTLPATGGGEQSTAVWLGVGALGLGAIAVAAGMSRRKRARG